MTVTSVRRSQKPGEKTMRLSHVLLPIVIVVAIGVSAASQGRPAAGRKDPETRKKEVAAMRGAGGLKEAAAVTGHYRGTEAPYFEGDAKSLEELTEQALLVIVGAIQSNRSWLEASGKRIVTDYQVVVERGLKGHAKEGDVVTVSFPAGRVSFSDGSIAEMTMTGVPPPANGQRFVFFLQRSHYAATPEQRAAARGPLYTPALKSLGMFLLSPERGVVPRTPDHRHPIKTAYANVSEATFVDAIANASNQGGKGK